MKYDHQLEDLDAFPFFAFYLSSTFKLQTSLRQYLQSKILLHLIKKTNKKLHKVSVITAI